MTFNSNTMEMKTRNYYLSIKQNLSCVMVSWEDMKKEERTQCMTYKEFTVVQ